MDKFNLHWKDVALGAIFLIQVLVGVVWVDLVQSVKAHELRIDAVEQYFAEHTAGEFNAKDASDMQLLFIREMQIMKESMRDELSSLRRCINQNIVENRRVACE